MKNDQRSGKRVIWYVYPWKKATMEKKETSPPLQKGLWKRNKLTLNLLPGKKQSWKRKELAPSHGKMTLEKEKTSTLSWKKDSRKERN